eukprot:scaffold120634_cov49-Prasinocladus_malaysianus.AAC.1
MPRSLEVASAGDVGRASSVPWAVPAWRTESALLNVVSFRRNPRNPQSLACNCASRSAAASFCAVMAAVSPSERLTSAARAETSSLTASAIPTCLPILPLNAPEQSAESSREAKARSMARRQPCCWRWEISLAAALQLLVTRPHFSSNKADACLEAPQPLHSWAASWPRATASETSPGIPRYLDGA